MTIAIIYNAEKKSLKNEKKEKKRYIIKRDGVVDEKQNQELDSVNE